jgi:hypothetical protein
VEPRRSYPGDGEQRWYDGEDWERGRHGAPAPDSHADSPAEGRSDSRPDSFNAFARFDDSGSGSIPPVPADPVEPSRRSTEAIDVAELRRSPVSAPPDVPPPPPAYAAEYGSPPGEFPPANYAPPAQYAGPAGSAYGPGGNPLSAPTAAVNTIPPASASVYHSRKPAVAIVLAVLTVLFEIPALRLLGSATVADVVSVSGVVSGTFLVLGLPVFAYGVYNLMNGFGGSSVAAWLRPPLVYLPLGALLFLLAALAAA